MTEPKFTPGPWFTDDYGYIFSGERRDAHMIAEVRGWGWIQYLPDPEQIQDANAHLIAAAPDLYKALAHLEPYLDAIVCYASTIEEHPPNGFILETKAALAKARGER